MCVFVVILVWDWAGLQYDTSVCVTWYVFVAEQLIVAGTCLHCMEALLVRLLRFVTV